MLSATHFSVDGTLLEVGASLKSFHPKEAPPSEEPPAKQCHNEEVDFHEEKRPNSTHASTADPEAKLAKKARGKEAKLSYTGFVLMENRNGLAVDANVTQATGTCEREAAIEMIEEIPGSDRATVGADKPYDTKEFVEKCRMNNISPHAAQKKNSVNSRVSPLMPCESGVEDCSFKNSMTISDFLVKMALATGIEMFFAKSKLENWHTAAPFTKTSTGCLVKTRRSPSSRTMSSVG